MLSHPVGHLDMGPGAPVTMDVCMCYNICFKALAAQRRLCEGRTAGRKKQSMGMVFRVLAWQRLEHRGLSCSYTVGDAAPFPVSAKVR